jgi:hypothetical protein
VLFQSKTTRYVVVEEDGGRRKLPPPTQKERKEKERKRKGRERKNIHWLAVFTMGSQRGGLSNLSIEFVVDDPGASGKEDRRTYIPVVIGIPDG